MFNKSIYKIISIISFSLLTACSSIQTTKSDNRGGWDIIFDANSNLNEFTQYGSANWRIQDGNIQADLLSSNTPAYLIT